MMSDVDRVRVPRLPEGLGKLTRDWGHLTGMTQARAASLLFRVGSRTAPMAPCPLHGGCP